MFKKIARGALIGAAALAMAVPAHALTEVHLFGASAQYTFWIDAAPKFLSDPAGAACLGTVQHAASGDVTDNEATMDERDAGAARGLNCQGVGEEVVITYTTFSSVKGIQAVKGSATFDGCPAGEAGVPDWQDLDGDGNGVTWGPYPGTAGSVDDLECQDIVIGASDVAGETFNQESHGALYGPAGGDWYDSYATPEDTTGLDECRPIVVPFAFFGSDNLPVIPAGAQGNLTRLQAVSIFSGQVTNWSDMGYSSLPVAACLRHAGSGTHATLDAAVMRGDSPLLKDEALPGSFPVFMGYVPVTYFNKGSSDEVKCVRDAGDAGFGAVGYADADKNGADFDPAEPKKADRIQRLKYMGADATVDTISNGIYDFWSAQWLYYRADEDPTVKAKVVELCNYASIGANIPASKAGFWAAEGDMKVTKSTDFAFPSWK
ncbi:hypothetical protein DSCA_22950 [Desulfosarcina alkanivorans]|uniref:PBP domain-containing protein n=1 Tax=Desulfosarcina alkanivorans TaxID=571177 RepID=A0A5K7YJ00_9BACT|nr:substrate-binding domain-containing protein [Desulfosarcina alkanivorans]BBO68365.1 hypothetical protein DSCA_22950 [Desulfosarcina alkanivorans]